MSERGTVQCATHGEQQRTYVCQHIVEGLVAKERRGFYWTKDDRDNPRPDAWCAECEERVKRTEGEWVGEALEHLKAKVLCGACYDHAKSYHMSQGTWS